MGLIEHMAPRLEVGAVRLFGVAALVAGGLTLVAALETGNGPGLVSVLCLSLAAALLLTRPQRNLLGLRGIAFKSVYFLVYFGLCLVAGIAWFAGAGG